MYQKKQNRLLNLLIIIAIFIVIQELFDVYKVLSPIISTVISMLTPFFIGSVLAFIYRPIIMFLEKYHISRVFSFMFLTIFTIIGIILIIYSIFPIIFNEFAKIQDDLSSVLVSFNEFLVSSGFNFEINLDIFNMDFVKTIIPKVSSSITTSLSLIVSIFMTAFGIWMTFLFAFVMGLYITLDYERVAASLKYVFPPSQRDYGLSVINKINDSLRGYLSGFFITMLLNFILIYIGFRIINIEYAFTLAVISAAFYIIPMIGTYIGAIPAYIIGLTVSPLLTFLVIVVITVVNQISANIIEPNLIGSKIGVNPLIFLIGLVVLSKLLGVSGMIIAMPVLGILGVMTKEVIANSSWFKPTKKTSN